MDNQYNPLEIESSIQELWENSSAFSVGEDLNREKYYCLAMFPYPSGTLHIGHIRNYTLSDVIARYQRMHKKNVLHPIGWDAFGLPAENAAIQNKTNPSDWTKENINEMRSQFKRLGYSYDWKRELATCDPDYYRWEQWLFIKLYKKGLVYKKDTKVNWDPVDETVLANEQVIDGKGWRSGAVVEQKEISQWFIKITHYADELLNDLESLEEWPKQVRAMQKNWIGKSSGCFINFKVENSKESLKAYTTRVDTIFGVTGIFISPDHKISKELSETNTKIKDFLEECSKSPITESAIEKMDKKGVDTELKAICPITNRTLPIWIANYILSDYGTGVVMSVPAHCKRDWDMAKKYNLPISPVLTYNDADYDPESSPNEGFGTLINSAEYDGLSSEAAIKKIIQKLENNKSGSSATQYRLRDWGISRQRYWGTPIPMINCHECGPLPVPEEDLPVVLPTDIKFSGAQSPLKDTPSFYEAVCPKCNSPATRETDTFDTFINSSWYYSRYASYDQSTVMLDNRAKYWTPVDYYIGGIEHAVLHLLYARFMHKVLRDEGLLNSNEPFKKLLTLGMVLNQGSKMSKSKGNSISPIDTIEKYGADTLRLYIIFAAPPELSLEWSESGIDGAYKFLRKLWAFSYNNETIDLYNESNKSSVTTHIYWESASNKQKDIRREVYTILQQINFDYQRSQFNTVVSGCMKLFNIISKLYSERQGLLDKFIVYEGYLILIKALSPITPHICQVLWSNLGNSSLIMDAAWPIIPKDALKADEIEYIVQINGKTKGKITLSIEKDKEYIKEKVTQEPFVQKISQNKILQKTIIIPDRKLINLVYAEKSS